MEDFGPRLQQLRRAAKLSQGDLARAAAASRDIIGKYERGESLPSAESAVRLARVLGVSVGYLLGVEERPAPGDAATAERVRALDQLDPKARATVLEIIDTFVRDASARRAYAPAAA